MPRIQTEYIKFSSNVDAWHKWEHWNTTLNNLKTWKYLFSVIHIEKSDEVSIEKRAIAYNKWTEVDVKTNMKDAERQKMKDNKSYDANYLMTNLKNIWKLW